jgi:UDPglucose 6-dehydrogenase
VRRYEWGWLVSPARQMTPRAPRHSNAPPAARGRATVRRVGILGAGYMGLATGVAFAHQGFRVFAYDVNPRVRRELAAGRSPYHEKGLGALVRQESRRGRFVVLDRVEDLAERAEVVFVCLPTPSKTGGRIDLAPLRAGVAELGRALRPVTGYRVVVVKSTVVPGTTQGVVEPLLRRSSGKSARDLGVVFNPEFLSEGRMVHDTLHPQRIVLGASDPRAVRWLVALYRGFDAPVFELSPSAAELVKYASNAFLALKVSFANEIGRLTERLDGNVDAVMDAVGADPRIGTEFLRAGPGFGGSCFRKDLRAMVARADELGVRFRSGENALAINADQMVHAIDLVRRTAGTLRNRTVTVLGVAFKPGTDDVRESRALPLVKALLDGGARVRLHDPEALSNFRRELGRVPGVSSRVTFCPSVEGALRGADLAVLQTDWPQYRRWPARWTRRMRTPTLVDLRREISPAARARAGLRVVALGVSPDRPANDGRGRAPGRAK